MAEHRVQAVNGNAPGEKAGASAPARMTEEAFQHMMVTAMEAAAAAHLAVAETRRNPVTPADSYKMAAKPAVNIKTDCPPGLFLDPPRC